MSRTTAIFRHSGRLGAVLTVFLMMTACSSADALRATDKKMDLDRFMGDWYVVGSIPIDLFFASEAGAHNAVESYELNDDGSINTTYRFPQGRL